MAFNPQSFAAQAQSFGNVAELMKGVSSSETDKVEAKGFGQDVIYEGEERREKAKKEYKKKQGFWSNLIKAATILSGLPPGIREGVTLFGSKIAGEYAGNKAMEEMDDFDWQRKKSERMKDEFDKYTDSAAFNDAVQVYLAADAAGDERKLFERGEGNEEGYGSIFKSKSPTNEPSVKYQFEKPGGFTEEEIAGYMSPQKPGSEFDVSRTVGDFQPAYKEKMTRTSIQGWDKGGAIRPTTYGNEYVQGQLGRNVSSLWEGITSSYNKNIFGDKVTLQEQLNKVTL